MRCTGWLLLLGMIGCGWVGDTGDDNDTDPGSDTDPVEICGNGDDDDGDELVDCDDPDCDCTEA